MKTLFIFLFCFLTTVAFGVDKTFKASSGDLILDASDDVVVNKNLGVGTNEPSQKVEVSGGKTRLDANVGNGLYLDVSGSGDYNIVDSGGTDTVRLGYGTAVSQGIYHTGTNRIGVGNATPAYGVHISKDWGTNVGSFFLEGFATSVPTATFYSNSATSEPILRVIYDSGSGSGSVLFIDSDSGSNKQIEVVQGSTNVFNVNNSGGINWPQGGNDVLSYYASSTASCGWTGVAGTPPNITVRWTRVGDMVTVSLDEEAVSRTASGSVGIAAGCLPSDIRPVTHTRSAVILLYVGSYRAALAAIKIDGGIELFKDDTRTGWSGETFRFYNAVSMTYRRY